MSPKKFRPLRLKIRGNAPGRTRTEVIHILIRSIERGDYSLPQDFQIGLGWSNSVHGQLKWGEFSYEMRKSRESSPGFDAAVLQYLESEL